MQPQIYKSFGVNGGIAVRLFAIIRAIPTTPIKTTPTRNKDVILLRDNGG